MTSLTVSAGPPAWTQKAKFFFLAPEQNRPARICFAWPGFYVWRMTQAYPDFDTIIDDFGFIDDWDEKYRYLIDLGRRLPSFPTDAQTEENRVRGCASQVWLTFDWDGDRLYLAGDSDAAIVKGLVALILSLYSGRTKSEIAEINAQGKLAELDLQDHITPQRSNGLVSMINRIREEAAS